MSARRDFDPHFGDMSTQAVGSAPPEAKRARLVPNWYASCLTMGDKDQTRAHRPEALLEDSLAATLDMIRDAPESRAVRDLRARVESYRRTIERWTAIKPTKAQRDALRELVFELHTAAEETVASQGTTPSSGAPNSKR
jgi:hypothetical protein